MPATAVRLTKRILAFLENGTGTGSASEFPD